MAQIHDKARKTSWTAWAIIGFFLVTAGVTLLNQGAQLLKTIGWFP